MDVIEKEFNNKAIIRGGIYLFNPSDALDVIKKCNELNMKILGIDSFKITERLTQPVLDHSIEFKVSGNDGNWLDAVKFVQERINEGLVFEIVYE